MTGTRADSAAALHSRLSAIAGSRPDDQWFRIASGEAAGASSATVYLYGRIGYSWFFGGISARDFVDTLKDLDVDHIDLHINSPGGDLWDGLAIMNALRHHRASVTAYVDGLAASMASVIAVGGADEVVMSKGSVMMIHDAWSCVCGNPAEMRDYADWLDGQCQNLARLYAARTGKSVDEMRAAMQAETWYTDDEAVEAGLADRVDSDTESEDLEDVAARFDLSVFAHADSVLSPAAAARTAPHKPPAASASGSASQAAPAARDTIQEGAATVEFTTEQQTALAQAVGVPADADPDTIVAAVNEALTERANDTSASTLPPGVVTIDQEVLEGLRADAAAGREARNAQVAAHREGLVRAAIKDGRIPTSAKAGWLQALANDPDGSSEQALAGLQKGLIPVDEIGHDTVDDAEGHPTDLYGQVFPEHSTKEA